MIGSLGRVILPQPLAEPGSLHPYDSVGIRVEIGGAP